MFYHKVREHFSLFSLIFERKEKKKTILTWVPLKYIAFKYCNILMNSGSLEVQPTILRSQDYYNIPFILYKARATANESFYKN